MKEVMMSEDFADVTLVSNDKKITKAHRNIRGPYLALLSLIFGCESSRSPISRNVC